MPYVTIPRGYQFHFKTGDGQAESYLDKSKPTLVLLHPCAQDSTFFQPQLSCAKLTDKYNLIAIDSHYHGLTKVPLEEPGVEGETPYDHLMVAKDLVSVLDALEIGQCHLFGANSGSFHAIRMATVQPQRFLSIFLSPVSPPADFQANAGEYHSMHEDCLQGAADGSDSIPAGILNTAKLIYYGQCRQGTSKYWKERTNFRPSNPKHINKIFSMILDRDRFPETDWARIKCPVMAVQGVPSLIGADMMHPPSTVKLTLDHLVNAPKEFRIIEGGPNLVSRTHTDTINDWLMDFIDGRIINTPKGKPLYT